MANNTQKIAELDEAIQSGVTSTSGDGHSVTQDLDQLRRSRRELALEDDATIAAGKVKPTLTRMTLGGAW